MPTCYTNMTLCQHVLTSLSAIDNTRDNGKRLEHLYGYVFIDSVMGCQLQCYVKH